MQGTDHTTHERTELALELERTRSDLKKAHREIGRLQGHREALAGALVDLERQVRELKKGENR